MRNDLSTLLRSAQSGDAKSQCLYAQKLLDGAEVDRNPLEAYQFFEKAAFQGNKEAMFRCGEMLEKGSNGVPDLDQAMNFYEKAAEHSHAGALFRLGEIHWSRQGAAEVEKALHYFGESSKSSHGPSFYYLGLIHESQARGSSSPSDSWKSAFDSYESGAKLKDLPCLRKQAWMLREGVGVAKDSGKALMLYLEGSFLNDAECIFQLGLLMLRGEGCPPDVDGGWENVQRSADLGFFPAMSALGLHLCESDAYDTILSGLEYLKRATQSGTAESFYHYGANLFRTYSNYKDQRQTAIESLRRAVSLGSLPAMHELSVILLDSEEDEEKEEGMRLCRRAAESGFPPACLDYGILLYHGKSEAEPQKPKQQTLASEQKEKKDLGRVRELFQVAADAGVVEAQYNLALMCSRTEGGPLNLPMAIDYFQRAAAAGNTEALYCLYDIYRDESSPYHDEARAIAFLEQGVELKDSRCLFALGQYYEREGPHQRLETARSLFYDGADRGHLGCIRSFASMCYHGVGGPVNLATARQWFQIGEAEGDLECTYSLAFMAQYGQGGPKDLAYARELYLLAADQGHVLAKLRYGEMVQRGEGGVQDTMEALEYFGQAGELGNSEALLQAAQIYAKVNPRSELTHSTYQSACEIGNEDAMFEYGKLLLAQGDGESKAKGRVLFDRLVRSNYPGSHYYLAHCCHKGIGGDVDQTAARAHYRVAAMEGITHAKYWYACFLRDGLGGDADPKEARYWAQEAADEEDLDAIHLLLEMGEAGEGGEPMPPETLKKYRHIVNDEVSSDEEPGFCIVQ